MTNYYDSFDHFALISLQPWASGKTNLRQGDNAGKPAPANKQEVISTHFKEKHHRKKQASTRTHQDSLEQLPSSKMRYMAGPCCCITFTLNFVTSCSVQDTSQHVLTLSCRGLGHSTACISCRSGLASSKKVHGSNTCIFRVWVGDLFINLLSSMSGTGETFGSAPKKCLSIHAQEIKAAVAGGSELRATWQSSAVHKAEHWTIWEEVHACTHMIPDPNRTRMSTTAQGTVTTLLQGKRLYMWIPTQGFLWSAAYHA